MTEHERGGVVHDVVGVGFGPSNLALAVALGGLVAAARGRGGLTALLAVVLGWLLLVQGLPDVDVLWTANVLAGGPVLLTRAAVAVLVALGAGCVVGGLVATRRFRERRRPAGEPLLRQ